MTRSRSMFWLWVAVYACGIVCSAAWGAACAESADPVSTQSHQDASNASGGTGGGDASIESGVPDAGQDSGAMDAGAMDAQRPEPDAAPNVPRPDAALPDAGDPDAGPPPREHGIDARVLNTTCFLNGAPPLAIVPVDREPVFPMLDAPSAASIVRAGAGELVLVERAGRVRVFTEDGDGGDAITLLDLSAQIRAEGLRGAVLRPDGGALFATYVPLDEPLRIVLSRFDITVTGVASLASEDVLLSVPLTDPARAGGALVFLHDGTLVAAFGDGGEAALSEDPAELAGKVIRIAVDDATGYAVPADNPFLDAVDTLDPIYALGLGAPTSCSIDRVTGRLWCADAGGATRDEILLVTKGATLRPILSFTRTGCGIVLGFVSRDAELPDVQGALVFGDACSSSVQALRFDGSLVRSHDQIVSLPAALAAFGEDSRGRMRMLDANGDLHALVRPATPLPDFPTTVSATGCLSDVIARAPAPSLIPFEVRAPLWSDGAKKHRFIVLPGNEKIGFTLQGAWQFPIGTMFMKEFLLDDDSDTGTRDRILETRFLVRRSESAWEGYSYMWDQDRRDAFLLDGAEVEGYAMQPGAVDASGASVHRHAFPDRVQCLLCHNAASGRALGLQTGRMNTAHDYDGFVENQLEAMDYVGLFAEPLPSPVDALPRFAEPADTSADLEARARSWLYANCAHCHRPGGTTPVPLDFRAETSLLDTQACGLNPRFPIAQIPDAKIIDPGHADNSELFFRMSRRDPNQMPPIATLITDPIGVEVVGNWIESLTACPE